MKKVRRKKQTKKYESCKRTMQQGMLRKMKKYYT